jgi:pimeloyl-ACP methyl ester carboxylesterase
MMIWNAPRAIRPPQTSAASHGKRAQWMVAGLAAVALFVAACSGSNGHKGGAAGATTTVAELEQPSVRCGAPHTKATLVRFKAADGISLDGVMVGDGQAGVVLVHEYPADLCGFWPFANYLARHGLRAFAIDLRCFGQSECPDGAAKHRVIEDIAAAIATLRRHGVTRVALIGASMGGAAVLIAGTAVQPPVAAVVSLSGEADPTKLVGGIPSTRERLPSDSRSRLCSLSPPTTSTPRSTRPA